MGEDSNAALHYGSHDNIPEIKLERFGDNSRRVDVRKTTTAVDDEKKMRRKRKLNTPLENINCKGVCGPGCLSKPSTTTPAEQLQFSRCENFYSDLKCPMWVGDACAEKHNNLKCRICALLGGSPHELNR